MMFQRNGRPKTPRPPREPATYDIAAEQEAQGRIWRSQIEAELEEDLGALDDEAQVRNVHFRSRKTLLEMGGTIRDVKREMNRADVAAIPYNLLWYFLNESDHADHRLSAEEVRRFLQVGAFPASGTGPLTGSAAASAGPPADGLSPTGAAHQPPANPDTPKVAARPMPKVKRSVLLEAIRSYAADPRHAGFDDKRIIEDIRAAFPDHQVSRDAILIPLRAIVGPRKRGPKPIRGKSSAE